MRDDVTYKGFVKLSRNLLDWEWYQDNNICRLMIHLLMKVNYTSKNWQGNVINPGELITSINNLSKELKLSANMIRNSLKKLEKTKYISIQSTNKFTRIKLLKSDIYDDSTFNNNKQNHNQNENKTHSNHNQITTTNKVNKEIELKERIELFKKEASSFQNLYSSEVLNDFITHWTEENKQTGRARFEEETYWNTESRLKKWKSFAKPTTSHEKRAIYLNR